MEVLGACCRNISREGELFMEKTRSSFTGKLGFVLAAAGSAVGLGNLWRFPYLAAQYGGGIFLLVYLVLVVTFGFALMAGEVALGRKTGLSAVGAFQMLNKKWKFLGYLTSIVPMIILPYYCVIGGWVIKYFSVFLTGQMAAAADASYFGNFAAGVFEPIGWLFVYLGITAVIVYLGVEKGVEKASRLMMPALVVLTLCVTVFVLVQPGALEGVLYYITPDFSRFSSGTVLAALGQLFYSMSLAMGIMITYGSYMKKDVNLEKSVSQIEIFDTGFAFLAGLMLVPAVTVFGDMSQMNTGPSLMFVTLPGVFAKMGPVLGSVVGALFFLLVLFAALTSSISLMETVVSILQDKLKWGRHFTCMVVAVCAFLIGIPSSLGNGVWANVKLFGMDFLTFFDYISNSVLMPIVAFLTCLFIGWVMKPDMFVKEIRLSSQFHREKLFRVVIRYIAPVCIVAILVSSVFQLV